MSDYDCALKREREKFMFDKEMKTQAASAAQEPLKIRLLLR